MTPLRITVCTDTQTFLPIRTGSLFAFTDDARPDLLCIGKGMAGGFPISACLGTARVMDAWGASQGEALHTQTFLGNPVGCAMALACIERVLELLPEIVDLKAALQPLVRAHQLLNDLVDLDRDAATGSRSWLLARARAGAPSIAHWLLVGGGLDAVVAEIRDDLSRARAAAAEADLPGAVPWLDARERLVDTIKAERMRQAMAALFTR